MPTSNRSVFRPWRMSASVTISNRRVRTRTHGGVAGDSGQPLPLCRSNAVTGHMEPWDGESPILRGTRGIANYLAVSRHIVNGKEVSTADLGGNGEYMGTLSATARRNLLLFAREPTPSCSSSPGHPRMQIACLTGGCRRGRTL